MAEPGQEIEGYNEWQEEWGTLPMYAGGEGNRRKAAPQAILWIVLVSCASFIVYVLSWDADDPNSPRPGLTATARAIAAAEATKAAIPTPTPVPTKTPAELADGAEYFDPRLLTSNSKGHVGENIYLQGEAQSVEQHDDYTWIHMMAKVRDRPVAESVVVELRPPEPDLLSSECYRFYGIIADTTETRVVLTGASSDRPLVQAYQYESSPREDSGCAASD